MIPNADKSEETRKALIRSATEIISKKGYAKTTLDDIAKNIHMTRGAFYWHFKNKSEILHEIEDLYVKQYLKDYEKFDILPSAYDTLRNLMIHQLQEIFEDNYISYAFIIRYRIEALTELPDLVEKQIAIDDLSIQGIAAQVERGKVNGEFRADVNAWQAAVGIFTFIVGAENVKMLHAQNSSQYGYDYFIEAGVNYINMLCK